MKNVLMALALSIACAPLAKAQDWFPVGATWTYDFDDMYYNGYVTHEVTGDSVVDGVACRVIDVVLTYQWAWGNPPDVFTTHRDPYLVHESDGLAFIQVPGGGFDTLYNMQAEVGDRWMLAPVPEPCDTTAYLEVVDTGTMILDGIPLKWLAVDLYIPYMYMMGVRDTIVNRLGALHSYFVPQNLCMMGLDAMQGGPVRCYQDDEITFMAGWVSECKIPLGMADRPPVEAGLTLQPDPGGYLLQLRWPDRPAFDVDVRDATGRLILRTAALRGTPTLDLTSFPSGLYLFSATAPDGRRAAARWVKP